MNGYLVCPWCSYGQDVELPAGFDGWARMPFHRDRREKACPGTGMRLEPLGVGDRS